MTAFVPLFLRVYGEVWAHGFLCNLSRTQGLTWKTSPSDFFHVKILFCPINCHIMTFSSLIECTALFSLCILCSLNKLPFGSLTLMAEDLVVIDLPCLCNCPTDHPCTKWISHHPCGRKHKLEQVKWIICFCIKSTVLLSWNLHALVHHSIVLFDFFNTNLLLRSEQAQGDVVGRPHGLLEHRHGQPAFCEASGLYMEDGGLQHYFTSRIYI